MNARVLTLFLAAAVALALIPGASALAGEDKVLVSRPGTVFHKAGATDVRGRGVEKSLDSALAAGYTPCRVCFARDTSASSLAGRTGTGAAVASTGSGKGGGPNVGPAANQPNGLQFASSHHDYLEKAVRNPYDGLDTITFAGHEQGAYGEDVKGGHYIR